MEEPRAGYPERSFSRPLPIAVFLAFAAVMSVAWQGFVFPSANNTYHIPIVLGFAQSAEGPKDFATGSLRHFVSYFWVALSLLSSEQSIKEVFLLAHVTNRVIQWGLLYLILRRLQPDVVGAASLVGLAVVFGALPWRTLLADNEALPADLSHSSVVISSVLLSWWCLLGQRWIASGIGLGLAFNVNAFVAVWAVFAHAVVLIGRYGRQDHRLLIRHGLLSATAFMACAAPTAWWIATATHSANAADEFSFNSFMREYYPAHVFIDRAPGVAVVEAVFVASGWCFLTRLAECARSRQVEILRLIFKALLIVVAVGCVQPYLIDSRFTGNLYPLRMDSYLLHLVVLVVFAFVLLMRRTSQPEADRTAVVYFPLIALLAGNAAMLLAAAYPFAGGRLAGQHWRRNAILGALLALTVVVLATGTPPVVSIGFYPRFRFLAVAFLIGCLFSAGGATLAKRALYIAVAAAGLGFPEASIAARVFVSLPILAILLSLRLPRLCAAAAAMSWLSLFVGFSIAATPSYAIVTLGLGIAAGFAGLTFRHAFDRITMRTARRSPALGLAAAASLALGITGCWFNQGIYHRWPLQSAWEDAQHWARAHTPPGSQIFANLDANLASFSVFSRRPSWFDAKLGATVLWAPEYYPTWKSRAAAVRDLAGWVDYEALAAREGIDYIVLPRATETKLGPPVDDIAYANASFFIVRVAKQTQ